VLVSELVATAPFQVRAQHAIPTVGVVSPASSATTRVPEFFLPAMKEFGWEDGRNCREEVSRELAALESAHLDAFNVLDGPLAAAMRESIAESLNRGRLPAIYAWPEIAEQGGLLGYGARLRVYLRQMARLVSKILDGARPQDLPIEQPDRYDLTVNLKTAKTLGLTMPLSILARADEVIEGGSAP